MTIASSTTRPTDSTIASSVSRLIVKPAISIRNTAPTSEIGIATIGMRTELNDRDVAEPDDHTALLLDDELPELLGRLEVGVGHEIHRHHRPLRLSKSRQVVVSRKRVAHRRRSDAVCGHAIGLEPDAHGEG